MSTTVISTSNAIAKKSWSERLSFMAGREATPLKTLSGDMPTEDEVLRKSRLQTTQWMPIIRVDELTKTAGDRVQIDCGQIAKFVAIMDDQNAEGMGPAIDYSSMELKLNMATLPISAGGVMSQQRTVHDLRKNAIYQLSEAMPRFRWQRSLTAMAGTRGKNNGVDWILKPNTATAADPTLAAQLINTVQAPTYNRHFVVSAGTLVQGGLQLGSIVSTDVMRLSVVDELAAIWSEMPIRMRPIRVPGDPAAGDSPIKGILFMDPLVWDNFITDNTANNNIRKFETDAIRRAEVGNLRAHPLFSGDVMIWNDILIRKMAFPIRMDPSDTTPIVTVANRLAGTESNQTVNASLTAGYQVARSLFVGAGALGVVSGGDANSEETYTLLEKNTDNFGRDRQFGGQLIGSEAKLRWSLPNGVGDLEATDFGVCVIDSAVRARPT